MTLRVRSDKVASAALIRAALLSKPELAFILA